MPKLLDQVSNAARLRHLSLKTEKAYAHYIKEFILYHDKRHPLDMGSDEVRDYLTHMAVDKRVAASTQNTAFSALLFLYRDVLGREMPQIGGVVRARTPRHLPVVFTRDEVRLIMAQLEGTPALVAGLFTGRACG